MNGGNTVKLDELLNLAKTEALICTKYLVQYIFSDCIEAEQNLCPLMFKLVGITPFIINSVAVFAIRDDVEDLLDTHIIQEFVIELIGLLLNLSEHPSFFEIFRS